MTSRQLYEGVLIELNKENAPNILLEDFNYFANKAVNNYVNKRYNIYDINQQTTDDLRVLKATALLTPSHITNYSGLTMAGDANMATYEVIMPSDYLHILNCICIYKVKKTYKCYNAGDTWRAAATRLTADMYSQVLDNFWNKPTYKRPYYYIHNVNINPTVPTNPYKEDSNSKLYIEPTEEYVLTQHPEIAEDMVPGSHLNITVDTSSSGNFNINGEYTVSYNSKSEQIGKVLTFYDAPTNRTGTGTDSATNIKVNPNESASSPQTATANFGTDGNSITIVQGSGLPKNVVINGERVSNVERGASIRYGNVSQVRLEIRYGTDIGVFELYKVYVDYIKAPQYIRLTQKEIDLTEDTSQMLEYPDYVCQEIINELVHLVMENISEPRLQTHPVVTQSIANPAQAQTPEQAG